MYILLCLLLFPLVSLVCVFSCLGATNSVIDISPYKYRARGGRGRQPNIIEVDVTAEGFDQNKQQEEITKLQRTIDGKHRSIDTIL